MGEQIAHRFEGQYLSDLSASEDGRRVFVRVREAVWKGAPGTATRHVDATGAGDEVAWLGEDALVVIRRDHEALAVLDVREVMRRGQPVKLKRAKG